MRNLFFIFFAMFLQHHIIAQPARILHYTETSGFDHLTRNVSLGMFQQMGLANGFIVDHDTSGDAFNTLSNLQQYATVIFSNTTGDQILDSVQRQNFMQYMNGNGGWIGIHSATDTYRHSTANGSNTGAWNWYAETLGASVQLNPSHVSGTPVYRIDGIIPHVLLNGIPDPWFKPEEYYYWEDGYFNSANTVLQRVEQTTGGNGLVNSYDSARAVTWFRVLSSGGKVFYTALGHDASNFSSDTAFYNLLENAVLWTGNMVTSLIDADENLLIRFFPNPVTQKLNFEFSSTLNQIIVKLYTAEGRNTGNWILGNELRSIDVYDFPSGLYIIEIQSEDEIIRGKLIKQ